jgi:glycosyltransferase involved in cell wall biosynthesis
VRVLFSFPHKIGADRICYTAWEQVNGLTTAGVDVLAMPAAVTRPVAAETNPTLARGKVRIPFKLIGSRRAFRLHDRIVAKRLEALGSTIDVVHVWPSGALETLRVAKRLGIPAVMERPNAHTRYAYDIVNEECKRIGVQLPPGDDYTYRDEVLALEEEEFRLSDYLLCPSAFTVKTFQDRGFPLEKLVRHGYGYDEARFWPDTSTPRKKFTVLFVGVAAVRKGLHFALEAWKRSPAMRDGQFMIAGEIAPDYQRYLQGILNDSSVVALGHRQDIPELMRQADILVLPSLEEGYGLVCAEAIGSGCVPLVSEACTDICVHTHNALVHPIGDVETLSRHMTQLYEDRKLLQNLRETCIRERLDFTWKAAGMRLKAAYQESIDRYGARHAKLTARCE